MDDLLTSYVSLLLKLSTTTANRGASSPGIAFDAASSSAQQQLSARNGSVGTGERGETSRGTQGGDRARESQGAFGFTPPASAISAH